jgi:CRISP-associated protein Cas1
MIKRTLYFGNPAYLKTKDEQLVIVLPIEMINGQPLPEETKTVPIEDIGVLIIKPQQMPLTKILLLPLLFSNVIVLN